MWIGLSGSPRVAVVLPEGTDPADAAAYGSGTVTYGGQGAVEGRAVDESVYHEGRGGVETVLEERFRLVGEVVWAALPEATARGLQADLGLLCDLGVRTRRADDPEWAAELDVRVRRTTDVELTTPLRPFDLRTGRGVAGVRYGFRSVRTYTLAELGLGPVGGFDLVAETDEYVELAPYGDAEVADGPSEAVTLFDGSAATIETLDLGPARVAGARVADRGTHYDITTRTPS